MIDNAAKKALLIAKQGAPRMDFYDARTYTPPVAPPRPITEDYKKGVPLDDRGNLSRTIEGRPLTAQVVAGRSTLGDLETHPDRGVDPDALKRLGTEAGGASFLEAAPRALKAGASGELEAWRDPETGNRRSVVRTRNDLSPEGGENVRAHEVAHLFDWISGKLPVPSKGPVRDQMEQVYHHLATGKAPKPGYETKYGLVTPEAHGYKGEKVNKELAAESIRAYLTNPNYLKTVAPKAAALIRDHFNDHPYLSKFLQFNSAALALLGSSGMYADGGGVDPAKAIRRAVLVAKGLSRAIGPMPGKDEGERVHPASLLPGVHVQAFSGGGEVQPTDETGFDAFHGTPHSFDQFDLAHVGRGEGAQAYGHGAYVAGDEGIAKGYRNKLSGDPSQVVFPQGDSDEWGQPIRFHPDHLENRAEQAAARALLNTSNYNQGRDRLLYLKKNAERGDAAQAMKMIRRGDIKEATPGHIYHVRVNANPEHFLDWDKPLSEQHPHVQQVLSTLGLDPQDELHFSRSGKVPYYAMSARFGRDPEKVSAALHAAGIPGIRYLDANSRGPTGAPTHNHVIFDPSIIDIKRRYKRGGGVSQEETELQRRMATLLHENLEDPEKLKLFQNARESYAMPTHERGAYSSRVLPMAVHDVATTILPLGNAVPKQAPDLTWRNFIKTGQGGTIFTLGGDRSNLGRLTHINDKPLAWPVDLHAGVKYMAEPNPGAVWANAKGAASALRKNIVEAAKRGPVYGAFAPMGPKAVDSSVNMFDALMAQVPSSGISAKDAQNFDSSLKAGVYIKGDEPEQIAAREKAKEKMQNWPGIMNAKKASEFGATLTGAHRSAIVKHLEAAPWQKAGFPSVGMTRAAITDPELLGTSGNMMGHHVAELDPSAYDRKDLAFEHSTYGYPTKGKLVGKLPFVERHVAMPDFADQQIMDKAIVKKTGSPLIIHPYSPNDTGRSSWRGNTELRQAIQPINSRMQESIQQVHGSDFAHGGNVIDHALSVVRSHKPHRR
jgi:hypothetical protein